MRLFFCLLLLSSIVSKASAQPVIVEVNFKLTDLDYKPLPDAPVRLVFGSDKDWQSPTAGQQFITDAKGEARLTANVAFDKQLKKMPTNFVSSLFSAPQQTDHILVGVELEYMEFRWLYTVEIFHFRAGTDMLGEVAIYSRDGQGRFTRKAERKGSDWIIADLRGLVATTPGYEPWNFALEADPSGKRWQLKLAFKKFPPPVRR
jgi:hypothetical protein